MTRSAGFDRYVETLVRKWGEVPGGSDLSERNSSRRVLELSDGELLEFWDTQFASASELRGWYHRLYSELFAGRRVAEMGSGLGFDGIHFLGQGAQWTFCDIVEDNLHVIERVVRLKGLKAKFLHIRNIASFAGLESGLDFVWCDGSMHHAPFDIAAEEAHQLLARLKPGGRWIELVYPYERWYREGEQSFERWGESTDGRGTPWAEWYDTYKLKERLFPYQFRSLIDLQFSSNAYGWYDLEYTGKRYEFERARVSLEPPRRELKTPKVMWSPAWSMDLPSNPFEVPASLHVACRVSQGSVGFVVEEDGRFVSREQIRDLRDAVHLIEIPVDRLGPGMKLLLRNASGHGASKVRIESIELRPAL